MTVWFQSILALLFQGHLSILVDISKSCKFWNSSVIRADSRGSQERNRSVILGRGANWRRCRQFGHHHLERTFPVVTARVAAKGGRGADDTVVARSRDVVMVVVVTHILITEI